MGFEWFGTMCDKLHMDRNILVAQNFFGLEPYCREINRDWDRLLHNSILKTGQKFMYFGFVCEFLFA